MDQRFYRDPSALSPFVEAPGLSGILTALTWAVAASVTAVFAIEALGL